MAGSPQRHESPIRPYVLTGGRVAPTRTDLVVETVLIAVADRPPLAVGTSQHIRDVLDVLEGPLAVAEVAASLQLPVVTVLVLVEDLITSGHLRICAPAMSALPRQRPDVETLRRVLSGLQKL